MADLISGLCIGRETMVANGTALSTIADNLANTNTTAYKTQRPEFGALFTQNLGSLYGDNLSPGNGSQITSIAEIQEQGIIENTGRELDFAIDGKGYFVVNHGGTATTNYYTRAGSFSLDKDGNVVTTSGENVMGYTAASPDVLVPLNTSGVTSTAVPTTTIGLTGNLDASSGLAATTEGFTTFRALNEASQFSTSVTIVDSLGASHDVAIHFFHKENLTWTAQAYVDAAETGGLAGEPRPLGQATTITFDNTGGQATGATTAITIAGTSFASGGASSQVAVDVSKMTGTANQSNIASITSNGVRPGTVTGITVDAATGKLLAQLTNGMTTEIGTIAMARFNNPGGLQKVGDSKYAESETSGTASIGKPDTDGRGSIQSAALEQSTVDTASQFVDMIRYQRGYQAGSQVISTFNNLLNTTLQLA